MRARDMRWYIRVVERNEKLHIFEGGSQVDASVVAGGGTHNDPEPTNRNQNSLEFSCVPRTALYVDPV